jgi:hypothetical protein
MHGPGRDDISSVIDKSRIPSFLPEAASLRKRKPRRRSLSGFIRTNEALSPVFQFQERGGRNAKSRTEKKSAKSY